MFVLINGAFGVGKSSVARELRARLPGSVIYDPEPIGVVLQRLVRPRPSDFQDLPSWRRRADGRSALVMGASPR